MVKVFKESVIQFICAMIIAWLVMFLTLPDLFFNKYAPLSFTLLFWLLTLGVIARGWPVAPPEGIWNPKMGKWIPGISMTVGWAALAILTTLFLTRVWPGFPLSGAMNSYGILLFMTTLWYALNWGAYPVAKKSGGVNFFIGAIVILAITSMLWVVLANYKDTPWAGTAFDPSGIFQVDYLFGLAVWVIAWIQIFGLSLQNYPFYKLGEPLGQIILTVTVAVLGYLSWVVSLRYMSPTFSFGALGGSIIGWTLFQNAIFGFYPNVKRVQPERGIYNLIVVAIMVIIWIPLLRTILSPIMAKATAAGLPVDISLVAVLYTLHVLAILVLAHNFFWLKVPFAAPGPPPGPEETGEIE